MPKEIKYVIFSDDEVRQAATAFYLMTGRPVASIAACQPVQTPQGIFLEVRTEATQYGGQPPLQISSQETVAALIVLCRAKKCPLPRNSMKFLNVINGRLTMVILVGMDNPQPLVVGDAIIYADEDFIAIHNRTPQATAKADRPVPPHRKVTSPLLAM